MFELRRSGIFRSYGARDLKGAITTKMALRWSWEQSLFYCVFQLHRSGLGRGPGHVRQSEATADEGERSFSHASMVSTQQADAQRSITIP
jgi:hypothetical protein